MVGTKSYTLARMAPSPRVSYLVTDQVPPFSQRMGVSLISDLVGTKSYTLARMAPSPRLSYVVTNQVPPLSRRVTVALTFVLLNRMSNTHI